MVWRGYRGRFESLWSVLGFSRRLCILQNQHIGFPVFLSWCIIVLECFHTFVPFCRLHLADHFGGWPETWENCPLACQAACAISCSIALCGPTHFGDASGCCGVREALWSNSGMIVVCLWTCIVKWYSLVNISLPVVFPSEYFLLWYSLVNISLSLVLPSKYSFVVFPSEFFPYVVNLVSVG